MISSRILCLLLILPLLIVQELPLSALDKSDFEVKSLAVISRDERDAPLSYPRSIFFDETAGEVYAAVSGRREMVIFTSDYYPVISVGHGRGLRGVNGGFADTDNLFFCLAGNSGERGSLLVYDRALLPVDEIELTGFPEADIFKPRQVVLRDGFFYITGLGSKGLLQFTADGLFKQRIIPRDEVLGVEEEAAVRSFRIDSRGRLFLLSEVMGRIFVYSPESELLFKFGTKGGSSGKLSRPRALALDEKLGLVFVVDYMRHAVNVYSMMGDYLFEFGGKGVGRGWFTFPSDIVIDDRGRLWIADTFNNRLQVFKVSRRESAVDQADAIEPENSFVAESPEISKSIKVPPPEAPEPAESGKPAPPLTADEIQESDL